jgi:hypothetical protein
MARHYHLEIAAFVADADIKWVDNLLSRFDLPGVEAGTQGVARRISAGGVLHIALIRRLVRDLALATDRAVALAASLLSADAAGVAVSDVLALRMDRDRLRHDVDRRLAQAVETIAPLRRGRPPVRKHD